MADFTTWAALKTAILNDLSNGSVLTKAYSVRDRSRTFHSLKEVKEFCEFCDMQTMAESGTRTNLVAFKRPD